MKFRIYATSTSSLSQNIEIEDEELEGLSKSEIQELVEERFFEENQAGICAQCSGWGKDYSLEIGDEWEVDEVRDEHGTTYE